MNQQPHFERTDETKTVLGVTLHRIRATRDIPSQGVSNA